MMVKYFDMNKQQDRSRKFSDLEKKRMLDILGAIDGVLAEYHHPGKNGNNRIVGYLPNIGTCKCGRPMTFYDVRLKHSVLSMCEIYDIAEALGELQVCLININASTPKRFFLYIGEIHGHEDGPADIGDG